MDDESDALAFELVRAGVTCASLICDPKSWINRRVETVDILSREETRRRVSIDFTLDARQVCDLTCRDGVVVPISVLTKDARRDFDLRDEAGRSIPVLGKGQNGRLAHIALMHAVAEAVSDKVPAEVLASLSADMRKVVFEPSERAAEALGHFIGDGRAGDRWRSVVWRDPVCQSLLATLWANYVLFAVVTPDGPPRRILKYAYGRNPGPAVSVLLAGAALFSGVAASRGEHRLVRAVFSGTRRWLAAIALAALAASSSLAMEMPDPHPLWVWRVAAVVCSAAALRLSWAAIRAPG